MALDDGCRIGVRDEVMVLGGRDGEANRSPLRTSEIEPMAAREPTTTSPGPSQFAVLHHHKLTKPTAFCPSAGVPVSSRRSDRVPKNDQLRRPRTHFFHTVRHHAGSSKSLGWKNSSRESYASLGARDHHPRLFSRGDIHLRTALVAIAQCRR